MTSFRDRVIAAYRAVGCEYERDAADMLGWSRARLNNYLSGKRTPAPEHLAHMARTFGVPLDSLIPDAGALADSVRNVAAMAHDLGQVDAIEAQVLARVADTLQAVLAGQDMSPAKVDMLARLVPEIVRLLPRQGPAGRGARGIRRAWRQASDSLGLPAPDTTNDG
jgi:transcriptional regulator with XRE-family HTH domain